MEHPQEGRRPHLILTRQAAIPVLHSVLAAPATRTVRGIETEVALGPEDGMPTECAISLDNTTVLRKTYFREQICRLDPAKLHAACKALTIAADC